MILFLNWWILKTLVTFFLLCRLFPTFVALVSHGQWPKNVPTLRQLHWERMAGCVLLMFLKFTTLTVPCLWLACAIWSLRISSLGRVWLLGLNTHCSRNTLLNICPRLCSTPPFFTLQLQSTNVQVPHFVIDSVLLYCCSSIRIHWNMKVLLMVSGSCFKNTWIKSICASTKTGSLGVAFTCKLCIYW